MVHSFVKVQFISKFNFQGILLDVESYFEISDGSAGLLLTLFVLANLLTAPVFGYLGDRFNRRSILIFGVLFWSTATLAGSFVPSSVSTLKMLNHQEKLACQRFYVLDVLAVCIVA
jgi:MFS family permease